MSLLWTQAMPWYDERLEPEEYEHDVRDVDEPNHQRGQRFKQRVMDHHGVDGPTAQKAIQHVVKHIDPDTPWSTPRKFGFASQPRSHDHYSMAMGNKLMDDKTWEGKQEEEVDLTEPIHASQNFVRPHSVAHNLFHPGQRQPYHDEEAVGDPDYQPSWDSDEDEEPSPELLQSRARHSKVYFMRRHDGRMEVVDGHHRVAANLLLGKKSMPGMVVHEHEIR